MQIVTDHGSARNFSCPYHRWKFGLNGDLISAPHMDNVDNFPSADCALRAVKVETWEGFVFVNLDPDSSPLSARLRQLDEIVGGYRMRDLVVAASLEFDCSWNWKILVENFMEAYHHVGPHLESVQPTHVGPHLESVQPTHNAKDSYVSGSVKDGWSVLHMPEVADAPDEEGLPPIEGLSEKQKTEILASLVMPTFAWLNTSSVAFWYELRPKAFNQMTLVIHTLLPKEIANSPGGGEIAEAVQATIEHIHLEDISVNEGPWKGLQSPLTAQGPLSLLEESIWQMNQWWLQRVDN
jgi:phenylpropionate dioxygenase-like ring-hydroxylating dioxygenase large terminal subunit